MTTTMPTGRPPPSRPPPKAAGVAVNPSAAAAAMELSTPVSYEPWQPKQCGRKIILYAVEGWGKTSAGAFSPKPFFLMAPNETGYNRLALEKRVPQIPARLCATWPSLLGTIRSITADKQIETLWLDAMGGFEGICRDFVIDRDFEGDGGEKGYASYGRGPEAMSREWLLLVSALDAAANAGIDVVILGHSKIRPYKNPTGSDYDHFVCDCHEKVWGFTHKWADAVLFGNFVDVVKTPGNDVTKKGKAFGGTTRQLFCERTAAFDAKNRFGMPASLTIPNDPAQVWQYIVENMNGASNGSDV